MNITLRRARADDVETLVLLLQALFGIEKDFVVNKEKQRKGLERLLAQKQSSCVLVAERQGEVVAMVTLQILISTAEGGYVGLVEDLIVDQPFRGYGVGRELLAAIESWAWEQGLSRLQLLADRSNQAGLNFYDNNGWKRTELIGLWKHCIGMIQPFSVDACNDKIEP